MQMLLHPFFTGANLDFIRSFKPYFMNTHLEPSQFMLLEHDERGSLTVMEVRDRRYRLARSLLDLLLGF